MRMVGAAEVEQELDTVFAALADSTRRQILARLAHGPATVNELAAPFAISLPAVSKHLKVLERAGLISRSRDGQSRPCALEAARLDAATDWIEHNRQVWSERFDKLAVHLRALQHPPTTEGQQP